MSHLSNHSEHPRIIDQGIALMQQHRDAEALVLFGRVESDHPSYLDAMINRGLLFFKMGETLRAISCLETVLEFDPRNADAYQHLGVIALETGDHCMALTYMRNADALCPEDPDILANLGVVLHAVGNVESAEAYLQKSIELDPENTHALSALSTLYLDSNACDQYRRYTDFDTYISVRNPHLNNDGPSKDAFLGRLIREVKACPSLRDTPLHRSTVGGVSTNAMIGETDSATEVLRAMFIVEAQAYTAGLSCPPDHPLAKLADRMFTTSIWANVLRAGGHQNSHIHPEAWLSGIYYVSVPKEVGAPESGQDGWVEFGRPRTEYHGAEQLDVRLIKPRPGMMILFPSYIWHRTIPLSGDAERISIAIDFIPQSTTRSF